MSAAGSGMKSHKMTSVAMLCASLLTGTAYAQHYTQTNLVSNVGSAAAKPDTNLVNGWGLSRSSTSPWWVSDNGSNRSTLYDGAGNINSRVVTVPGGPTGTVFNGTQDFQLAAGRPAAFLFASEDGTISGWNPNVDADNAVVMATTPGAIYKGLAIASVNGANYLYAADFHDGRIDVFDNAFHRLSDSAITGFRLRGRARGLSPFNIQNIGGNLFVTYAQPDADREDDMPGEGLGLVAAFSPDGELLRVFEHVVELNAPWGLALAPGDFGSFSHHLLVGQFGSGQIAVFDLLTGRFAGLLLDSGGLPIQIDGLWGLGFGGGGSGNGPANALFFSAGPNGESNGLFGMLAPVAADLTQGNGN
jgi:uncharacterized protein (TIGR03118 family)